MKRNRAAWVLLPVWIAASAACQSELEDGPAGTGGGTGGGGEQPSTTTSQTVSSGSPSGGAGCVLDESKLDGCALQ